MPGSEYIYKYLGTIWDNLPNKEKKRFSEYWKGLEQVWADVFQTFIELDQSINISSIPPFLTTRWNKYTFNSTNEKILPATFTAFQDISSGLNLSQTYLIKVALNEDAPIEVDCRGRNPELTTIDEIKFLINEAFGFSFASGVFENTILQLQSSAAGPSNKITILKPSDSSRDATEIILGLTTPELPYMTPRYPFVYVLPARNIMGIPSLQDTVRNEVLTYYVIEGPDFVINRAQALITFKQRPPEILWAKVTQINEETPFHNFGWLIDYADQSIKKEDYLQNLQGLWFAFWQGPKPELIRRALYLLFSLPVAARNGVVLSRTDTVIEILHDDNIIRNYVLPSQLDWLVNTGEYVEQFQPLVTGIDVFDKTNLPGFVRTEIGRDAIHQFALDEATEGLDPDTDESKALIALEEHTFLPQINVNAFVRPTINIGTVISFLSGIKPLHKAFYFQVIVAIFNESVGLNDKLTFNLTMDVTPNLDSNQVTVSTPETLEQYETEDIPSLDLDSDTLGMFERGALEFSDLTGPLPQYDVVFD